MNPPMTVVYSGRRFLKTKVVNQDDRTLEVLLDQVALVLRLQVAAPVAREFELAARSLQNLDALGVVKTLEVVVEHETEPVEQPLVPHLVHELEVLHAVVQRILDEVLEEVLGQFHVVLQVVKGGLGLNHPELRGVARRVGVLGAERGAEGVDAAQREGTQLAFELTRDGQVARLAEEVLRIVHLAILRAGRIGDVERRHLEHSTGTLAVRSGDDGGVEVVESVAVEVLVDGVGHGVADAQHGAEGVGARTQVGDVAQELERVALLLERVGIGVGRAVYLDFRGLHLDALTRAGRGDQTAVHTDAGARGDGLELLVGEFRKVNHHLDVRQTRAVVHGDEGHVLVAALGAHPTLDDHVRIDGCRLEYFSDSLCFHIVILLFFVCFSN